MKFRLGFVSNSSSCTYIVSFPKEISEKEICKAKLKLANPPLDDLLKILNNNLMRPYSKIEHVKEDNGEQLEQFLDNLTIINQDDTHTIFSLEIPFSIYSEYDQMLRNEAMYMNKEMSEQYFGHYKKILKKRNLGFLNTSNESGNTVHELLYWIGFKFFSDLHPEIIIEDQLG